MATKTTKAAKVSEKTQKVAAEKNGQKIGKPQMRVLAYLAKAKGPVTRTQIGEKTEINSGFCGIIGHRDPEKREPQSLLAMGLIRQTELSADDNDGKAATVYEITAAGKKALQKLAAE